MKKFYGLSLAVISTLSFGLIIGCSSENKDEPNSNTDSNISSKDETVVTINGVVMDGYLDQAKVCLDLNYNSKCESDEPGTMSNDGRYTFKIDKSYKFNYPVIAQIIAGTTVDSDNSSSTIDKSYTLTSTIDKPEVISPLTTLITRVVDKNSSLNSLDAASVVSNKLGITTDSTKLFDDYIRNSDGVSKQLHEISKVIAKLMIEIEGKITSDLGISEITNPQRLALNYLINNIVMSNISTIAIKIKNNISISDLGSDIDTIVQSTTLTQDDLDKAISATTKKTITQLFAGKTFYTSWEDDSLEKLLFSTDMRSLISQQIFGGNEKVTSKLSEILDYKLEGSNDDGAFTISLKNENDNYIIVLIEDEDIQQTIRLYYNKDKAMEYFGLKPKKVPTQTIATINDWNSILPIYTETSGDASLSGLDIVEIKMVQDSKNLYINLKRAGLDFPTTDYYYNYWIYFKAGDKTFSIENFHDNQGSYSFRIYRGIGYDGGTEVLWKDKTPNISNVNLQLVVPKSLNLIENNIPYSVSLFTHGFKEGSEDIEGEIEADSKFLIEF